MRSLGQQLHIGLAIGLLVLLGVLGWGGVRVTTALADHFVGSRLVHDAEAVLSAMRLDESDRPLIRWRRLSAIYDQPFSGHYYQVTFPDGHRVGSRSLWDQQLEIPQFAPGSEEQWRMPGPDGQELLVRVAGYSKQGRTFTLVVAEDMTPLNRRMQQFEWLLVSLVLLITLLLFVGQQWIVRRALRPLERMSGEMRRLEQGEVSQLTGQVPREVAPLVDQFNHLLTLFQQRLEHSRKGLGNLSHALKGPINLLQQQLQSEEMRAYPDLKAQMEQQIQRVQQLMEREMKRARLAGTGISGSRFNPAEEMSALEGVLRQVYRDKSLQIGCEVPTRETLPVDREDMLELLGNLMDNACKWARGQVRCVIEQDEKLRIRVEDDGPGVSAESLARLAERGVRIDETVDGHGLGLAITKDMVKRYGGSIGFDRSPALGGLRVSVELPIG
ncbi:MAG: sensor histidine kinase [Sedimenticola sp.]|nr:sensor histidine kinase [Sedimenticola sp.]